MVDTGYVKPINKIVISGHVQSVELEVETETNMYAGRLVMHGGTNNEVVVSDGTAIVYGWLGYEQTPIMYRPASVDTIYAVNARAAVLHGPGMVLVGRRKASETIVMGDKLQAAADGEVMKWVPIVDTGDGGAVEQQIVATAMEDGSGVASDLILRSEI
jgi:hypothetical protein